MTQKEYIRKLRARLSFFVTNSELKDIVSDIEEIFLDGVSDGKSEEQICLSLGSPNDAAKTILLERGVSFLSKSTLIKAMIFVAVTVISMLFLWNSPSDSVFIMPIIPLGLLLFIENGDLIKLMEKKSSISGIASCIIPAIGIFLFSSLTHALIGENNEALFPISAAITAATALSLVLSIVSVRVNPYGMITVAVGTVAALCIACFQIYAVLHISDGSLPIMSRSQYLNIFIAALFIAAVIIFVFSALRKDKASMFCMYAALGSLMIFSHEKYIISNLYISAEYAKSLWIECFGIIVFSIIITVISIIITAYLSVRKARKNG